MATDPERWARVRAVFEAALEREPSERSEFVFASSDGDPALQADVEALLAAADDPAFLEEPRAGLAAKAVEAMGSEGVGARVGPFRLVRRLGRGGMGDVYVGDRDDGSFQQTVAVKLIRTPFATGESIRRFERERAILASLNHPNIAHLVDGGLSPLGPYLAMELVEGINLLEYCDSHDLDVVGRLDLFATVCDAVHFAHKNLVVHRDLKPANVLVTEEGLVKLLDFGIAGLLASAEAETPPLTRTGHRLLTPEYASPEQVQGGVVSTAADVYALGVMLYELLAGERPYDLQGLSPAAVERRILVDPVVRPSETVTGPLRRRLEGDLDVIVMKAMHRDPTRRYESGAALAADVRRHLDRRPVLARPDTLMYRSTTFVRRHKRAVVAAGLLAVAVGTGVVATSMQARRADTRFDDTRELANSMLSELNSALADLPGATPVRARMLTQALAYLDELSSDSRADPALLLDIADAYDEVGEIQGNPLTTNLGDLAAARSGHEEAFRIRESVWQANRSDPRARRDLAASYRNLGIVAAFEGELQESIRFGRVGLDLLAPLEADETTFEGVDVVAGRLRSLIGTNMVSDGRWTEGVAILDTAIVQLEEAVAGEPNRVRLKTDLWRAYAGHANVHWYTGQPARGLELLSGKACPMLRSAVAANPNRSDALYGLQQCIDMIGVMQEQLSQPRDAEETYRSALVLAEALVELDPSNELAHEAVSSGHLSLGRLLFQQGRPEEGRAALERTAEIRRALREQNPSNERWTYMLGSVQREICRGLVESGAPDATPCEEAVANHELAAGKGPGVITQVTLAFALGQAARTHRALAMTSTDPAERMRWLRSSLEHYDRSVASYDIVGDLGPDAAWEIHPDTVRAERDEVRSMVVSGARPVT